MIVVAVVGLAVAASFEVSRLRELRRRYQIYARHHAVRRAFALQAKARLVPLSKATGMRIPHLAESDEEFAQRLDQRMRFQDDTVHYHYHDMLQKRYERAARYPWLPVPPDPIPPL
jgi:hypothetical protein